MRELKEGVDYTISPTTTSLPEDLLSSPPPDVGAFHWDELKTEWHPPGKPRLWHRFWFRVFFGGVWRDKPTDQC